MIHKRKSTVWSIESHTIIKHQILEEYLKVWFPILGRNVDRIVYLDEFHIISKQDRENRKIQNLFQMLFD